MSMLYLALEVIQEQALPAGVKDSPQAKVWFEKGKTALKDYHGELGILLIAYDCFKQSSETYYYMGVALMLSLASYSREGYDATGLSQAVSWLDKAKALSGDPFQAKLIEARLRGCFDQLEKAHSILDQLPDCLEVKMLRHKFLTQELRQNEAEKLFAELALLVQEEQPELTVAMARMYARASNTARAIELLEKELENNPHNPWLNHTLSLFYFQLGDLNKSRRHNVEALKVKHFPLALGLQQELRKVQLFFLKRLLLKTGLSLLFCALGLRMIAKSL